MKEGQDHHVETLDYARQGRPRFLPGRDNPRVLGAVSLVLAIAVLLPFLIAGLLIFLMLVLS
ncbi:MAG: hypothetical protein MI923_07505 [Phycisphaerales bacterium]|nr:hypothetical protein [Phycisphaerales bacterium]